MTPPQFGRVAQALTEPKHSRRHGLAMAGVLAGLGVKGIAAQEATPAVGTVTLVPDGGTAFMFVQSLGAGSIEAASDGVETLLLVADHLAGQTLFFSDRPERIVGMVPTAQFFSQGIESADSGFSPVDPPNAALVLPDGKILIVELITPEYDESTGQVRFQLRVLEDVTQLDLQLQSQPLTRDDAIGQFAAASLFIDDCPDGQVVCLAGDGSGEIGQFPASGSMGFCYDAAQLCCLPCQSPPYDDSWASSCNQTFASCLGNCGFSFNGGWACN